VLKNRRLNRLERELEKAENYEEWCEIAQAYDDASGKKRWREVDQTNLYDYASIRRRVDRLRHLRARGDDVALLFTLNEGIHGNMGGMGSSSLHEQARFGTKHLIEDYVDEIADALRYIAELDSDKISITDKLDFFYRANHCYGRSALMLSGGGIFGFYHLGVVKALLEADLLPRVISGSSAGSMIAGVLGTHTDEELVHFYDPKNVHFEAEKEATVFDRMLFGKNPSLDVHDVQSIVERLIPDMTFQEAYAKTGRQISITVAPAEPQQTSRLLNAITSPNVFIRSAVMASCAVPGVFPPVILSARNVYGDSQPYLPARKWVDGSISDDLPAKRLGRLYSTNHSIVSMVNPIVLPFLRSSFGKSRIFRAGGKWGIEVAREALNLYRQQVQRRAGEWPRFNWLVNMVHSLLDQNYSGDINIVPNFQVKDLGKVLSHITEDEMMQLMRGGEQAAWPEMRAIETCTKISRTLDEILERFERGDLKPIRAARRRPKRPANKKAQSKPAVKKSRKAVAGKAPVKKSEPRAVKAA
jgi:TAG lipase/steryl ester hydrolase/phospholipase A2/LPA acyltransferase